MTKTIFDVNDVASIKLDTESGSLTVMQKSKEEPLFIHKDDELYEYHLKNFEMLCKQLTDSFDALDAASNGEATTEE